MRISSNILSKITLIGLLLSVAGVSAMEYGDLPQKTESVRMTGSWFYNKFAGKKPAASQAHMPGALIEAEAPVAAAAQGAPSLGFSGKVALAIAGGALGCWAVQKIYTKQLYKNKMFLGIAGGAVAVCTAWFLLKSNNTGE